MVTCLQWLDQFFTASSFDKLVDKISVTCMHLELAHIDSIGSVLVSPSNKLNQAAYMEVKYISLCMAGALD